MEILTDLLEFIMLDTSTSNVSVEENANNESVTNLILDEKRTRSG